MVRLQRTLRLILVLVAIANATQAETLDHLKGLWRAAKYDPARYEQVIPLLLAYRNQPGGRTWLVNYMLGTSECRTPGRERSGEIALSRVLASSGLTDEARQAAEHELKVCLQAASASQQEPPDSSVPLWGQLGSSVRGKGGYEVDPGSTVTAKLQTSPVGVADLRKRVFAAGHSQQALSAALGRVGNARGAAVDRFVVVTSGELPPEYVGRCLVRYQHALQSEFKIESPSELITVYVPGDPQQVREYAGRLHGVSLPLGTVAYSVYDDLSIVGMAGYEACGSLAHELVHLSIRENFGDAPAWLEEGLASEVAVAHPLQSGFTFGPSWRDDMLRKHWSLRPRVAQLLAKSWSDYAAGEVSQVDAVAALHAIDASFIRYLDSKQKLVPVYFAMRDSFGSSPETIAHTDQEILETQLGMNLDRIDVDFMKWFGFNPSPSSVR